MEVVIAHFNETQIDDATVVSRGQSMSTVQAWPWPSGPPAPWAC